MSRFREIFSTRNILIGYTFLIFLFTYAPISILIIFSFNSGYGLSFPLEGFSLKWYETLFNKPGIAVALIRSLILASGVGVASLVVCTLTSLGLRGNFPGRDLVFYLVMLGMIMPGIVYGIGATLFYKALGIKLSLLTALPVHMIWAIPFGMLLMLARFDPQLGDYEAIARTLGSTGWRTFRKVTFPLISNQIMAAGLFGFTLSFGELMRSIFVVGGGPTLPIYVFTTVGNVALTADFYALGTLIAGVSFLLVALLGVTLTRGRGRKLI